MTTSGTSSAGQAFALGEALRRLATEARRFSLSSPESAHLRLQLDIEPLGREGPVARYRRTLTTHRDGQPAGRIVSTTAVDLDLRRIVAVQVEGLRGELRRAASLPASARIGETGHWFDHAVVLDAQPQRAPGLSTMSWSLEPWDGEGQALWCTHVQAADGTGIDSIEGYAISADGRIVGAALRAWVDAPSREPHRGDGNGADGMQRARRLIEMRTA